MTCPICAKKTDPKYRPFCSLRCSEVDLGRWLNESYAIPVHDDGDDQPRNGEDDEGPPRH